MRILVVDDEAVRHDGYSRKYPDAEMDHAYNVYEAINFLKQASEPYEIAFLDHDMGSGYPDGGELVRQMLKLPPGNLPLNVVVHSSNRDAAVRMVLNLRDANVPAVYFPYRA